MSEYNFERLTIQAKRKIAVETCDASVLAALANESDYDLLQLVARNTHCSTITLEMLATRADLDSLKNSAEWELRYEVARNKSTPCALLNCIIEVCMKRINAISKLPNRYNREFLHQAELNVLDAILINPNAPEEMKQRVSEII